MRGANGECGSADFPDIYARLEDYEILSWIYQNVFGIEIDRPQGLQTEKNDVVSMSFTDKYGNTIQYNGQVNQQNLPHGQGTGHYYNQEFPGTTTIF